MHTAHRPHAAAVADRIFPATEHDFESAVLTRSHEGPVLVDFWADWCAPCHALLPALEEVLLAYGGRLLLAKVEADENMRLAGRQRVRGFPTVLLFSAGVELGRFSSYRPARWIFDFLLQHGILPPR